jgi:hypothetical protein
VQTSQSRIISAVNVVFVARMRARGTEGAGSAPVFPQAINAGRISLSECLKTRRSYIFVNNRLEGNGPKSLLAMLTVETANLISLSVAPT